ncbi:hypothetical protein ONZ43_g5200 [Nemania bipapillata]|uniref:Uncharacterized protein n=1 Tax=Nemania bipapillata TaxID=110536 RepID=A0ACC2IDI7_9PEZI|nr:hypothetical protein ONZ43_g5200 [Nemania bipapillata]
MSSSLQNPSPPTGRHDFAIAIFCALPLEADAVATLFDNHWDDKYGKAEGDTNTYSIGAIGHHNIVLVHLPNMGKVAAATAAAVLRTSYPAIRLALVVGVCGGVPFGKPPNDEIYLGDIIISDTIIQHDFGRKYPHQFIRKSHIRDNLPRPPPSILAFLAKLQANPTRNQLGRKVLEYLNVLQQELGTLTLSCKDLGCDEQQLVARKRSTLQSGMPVIHFGLVASGDSVMKSGEDRDRMALADELIAFEMEGAGLWETFPNCLIIKGVCDYADSHKNKRWQPYAAATAAAATKAVLENWKADPGCGKSVLAKYLIDSELPTTKSRTTCYFFFKDDFADQRSARSALCCILHQLFEQRRALLSEKIVERFETNREHLISSFGELWDVLILASQDKNAGEIVCILDAFDECEDQERSEMTKYLRKFYSTENNGASNLFRFLDCLLSI